MVLRCSWENKDSDDIRKARIFQSIDKLLELTDRCNKNEYVILAEGRFGLLGKYGPSLIQVCATEYGWIVEYVTESRTIMRSLRGVSIDQVKEAFVSFLEGNKNYKTLLAWEFHKKK